MYNLENKLVFRRICLFLAILVAAAIFLFSAQEAVKSNDLSLGVTERLLTSLLSFFSLEQDVLLEIVKTLNGFVRKMAHFGIYFILSFFVSGFFSTFKQVNKRGLILRSVLICALYAVTDEMHQAFVPGRACQLRDVIIDSFGALVGAIFFILAAYIWYAWVRKK